MSEVCGDNRFELIGEFKGELIEGTNIEASPEEMAVLDNILFRIWQMGWLDKLKAMQGNGWQIEKRNCDNVQKTDLVCACGAPVLYDQILFPDGHTANRLFCSACGLSMRSSENDADGEWLKGRWAETVAAKATEKVDAGAGVVKELERVIVDATYPDRPRGFMMPLELAERVLAALKAQGQENAIPIDWLMRYAQLPTEYAIAEWQKPKRETWIKQIRSRDKPMSFDDALQLVNDQKEATPW